MSKYTNGKAKLWFGWVAFLVIVLSGLFIINFSKTRYSHRLNDMITELTQHQNNTRRINEAITMLYDAENNFRIFTLTGDSMRAGRYSGELKQISSLLRLIGKESLLKDKESRTNAFLQARLVSDSLWEQSAELLEQLKTHPPVLLYSVKIPKVVAAPSSIPPALSPQHKNLFARVRDAILNKYPRYDSLLAIMRDIYNSEENSNPYTRVNGWGTPYSDSLLMDNGLWSSLLSKLYENRGGLQAKEIDMLRANERLWTELKQMLIAIQNEDLSLAESKRARLYGNAQQLMSKVDLKTNLTIAFILLLTVVILWSIWRLYKNDQLQFQAKKEAEDYAQLKRAFAATISHEIRSPLHSITTSAEQISEGQPAEEQKKIVENLQLSSRSLLSVVNNILDYTQVENDKAEYEKTAFSPAGIIKEVINETQILAKSRNILMTTELEIPGGVKVLGNAFQLRQVLTNLITNAIKFTDRGTVTIQASLKRDGDKSDVLCVTVKDTGRGIRKEDLPNIFKEFYQVRNDQSSPASWKGSGLGLAIVKRIIALHKGKIDVESVYGKGSAFSFEIPYAIAADSGSGPKEVQTLQDMSLTGLRLLIVDNDVLHRKYMETLLAKEGARFHAATGGEEALDLLMQHDFDIILTDIYMPGMDGIELTKHIRQLDDPRKAAIPVIAATASILEENKDAYLQAGINGFLVKPFDRQDLIIKITTILNPKA